jgi:redox-sensing transcriptional repressor
MEVPDVVVSRLPQYVRVLKELSQQRIEIISSQQLGQALQMTPAQIRKDLSYFGRFGKQGRGYNVRYLLNELRQILGLDQEWNITVVGVGRLGRAIISYPGFAPEGFRMVAAFDSDSRQVGQSIGGLIVQPMSELSETIRRKDIRVSIVAVPAPQTAEVIRNLTSSGIKAILNYAPTTTLVPEDVRVRNIDPVLALQSMTYHLKNIHTGNP